MTQTESYTYSNQNHGGNYYAQDERRFQERDKSRSRFQGSQHGSQQDLRSSGRHSQGGHEPRPEREGGQGEVFENRIYVGGVPHWMVEHELNEYFSKYGEVENVTVIDRSNETVSNRYAFVTFTSNSVASVKKLLHEVDPKELTVTGGRTLTVGPARQKQYPRGGWHSHGDYGGGRYHHHNHYGGYQGDNRRRHFQPSGTWHRRGDKPHQDAGPRRPREDKAASDKEEAKDGGRAEQIPQQVFPDPHMQQQVAFGGDLVPSMMMPQHPGVAPPYPYPGYEFPGAGGMMYPGHYIAPSMAPGHVNNMGYMEYYDQQALMAASLHGFYGQNYPGGMVYPVLYPPHPGQPQYMAQQPHFPSQYPPQAMDMMSDSGYHDLTAASSILYQDNSVHHPQMEAAAGQDPPSHDIEASPILNMSNLITSAQDMVQEPGGKENGQQQATTPMLPPAGGRCFNTPNKSFAQFMGGYHLDPLGNKYPFRGNKGGRRHSSTSQQDDVNGGGFLTNDLARDAVIQPPQNNNNDKRQEPFKQEPTMVKRMENQPDILQDSLKQLSIQ